MAGRRNDAEGLSSSNSYVTRASSEDSLPTFEPRQPQLGGSSCCRTAYEASAGSPATVDTALVVGVDGGGTKTEAVVLEAQLDQKAPGGITYTELGRAVEGSSNRNSVGAEEACETLRRAVEGAVRAANTSLDSIACVCLCVSGIDTISDEEVLGHQCSQWLPPKAHLKVHNDSVAALSSGTGGSLVGCVLIAGTGTIAFSSSATGQSHRSSGWGPAFRDTGSGFDIGQQLLAAVARADDGRGDETAMTGLVLQSLGLNEPRDLLRWAYSQVGWAPIASLAPLVMEAAEGGDPVAAGILQGAAEGLAQSVAAAARGAGIVSNRRPSFPLVLAGGLLYEGSYLLSCLKEALLEQPETVDADIRFPSVSAATGAALLAAHQAVQKRIGQDGNSSGQS